MVRNDGYFQKEISNKLITQDFLKTVVFYDPVTGLVMWKIKIPHAKHNIGDVAGCKNKNNGYLQLKINKKCYLT